LIDAVRCRTDYSMTEEISSRSRGYDEEIPMGQETPVPPRPQ
jgi:hypothetical protein